MVFKEVATDEQILEAMRECLNEATVPAECVAEKLKAKNLGISTRRVRERLFNLEKDKQVISKKIGTGFGFRPVQ